MAAVSPDPEATAELEDNHDLTGRILHRIGSFTLSALSLVKLTGLDKLLQLSTTPLRWILAGAVCEYTTSIDFREHLGQSAGRDILNLLPFAFTSLRRAGITSLSLRRVGRWHHFKGVRKFVPYSAINVTDDTFSPPVDDDDQPAYDLKDFPFGPESKLGKKGIYGLNEWRAHFLSLCVKVITEFSPEAFCPAMSAGRRQ